MSLKIPRNGGRQLSPDQLDRIVCECGCDEFEAPHIVAAFSDRLDWQTLVIEPVQAYRCLQCFQYLKRDHGTGKWTTVRLHYDAATKPV